MRPHRKLLLGLLSSLLVAAQFGLAQVGGENRSSPAWSAELPAVRDGWATLVDAETLEAQLELLASEAAGVLTLSGRDGVMTLFQDSSEILWRPADGEGAREESLSAAVRRREDGWWLPVDALSFFGLWLRDGVAEGPDNLVLRLVFPPPAPVMGSGGELVDLGAGVPGLRLFANGPDGPASQSLLLADAGLLGLALPDQRSAFDELVAGSGTDHPLLLLVTSASRGPWDTELKFSQGELSLVVRYPFRLRLLAGQPELVAPDAPITGVVLLPAQFDLRSPIEVSWGGTRATVTFRR
ncbi:MAG TPA: hypothetical protein VF168_08210 [Trueperaceae bacterium]